jgi:hypothetical protein
MKEQIITLMVRVKNELLERLFGIKPPKQTTTTSTTTKFRSTYPSEELDFNDWCRHNQVSSRINR